MPLRIAFDARLATWSGIGTYTVGLLKALADQQEEFDISLLVLRGPKDGFLEDLVAQPSVTWAIADGDPWSPLGGLAAGRAARGRADLYHTPHVTIPLGFDGPLVTTVHDLIPLLVRETMPSWSRRTVFRLMLEEAVRRSAVIICDTRHAAATLYEAGLRPRSLSVVPLGVAPAFRPQPPQTIAAARQAHGLERDYVIWAGAFRPHKNVATLVRAYAALPPALRATYDVALIGDPATPYGESIRALASSLLGAAAPQVHFLGFVDAADLPPLYAGAAALVFPSLIEGFGLPPLEAAACGTAVLSSNRPPMPEVLGEGARYFDPTDPPALARLLGGLLLDDAGRKALGERSRRRSERFTWEETARRVVEAYRAAASSDGAGSAKPATPGRHTVLVGAHVPQ